MKWKELAGGSLIGGGLTLLAYWFMKHYGVAHRLSPSGHVIPYFISLITAYLAATAMHELGHLCTGLLLRFRFYLFITGPLGIKRNNNGKVVLFFNKNLALAGGIAATAPVEESPENYKKYALVLLAGPLTSLLFGVLCIVVFLHTYTPFSSFIAFSGLFSIALFFATTLPRHTGGFLTDRARVQRLLVKGKARAAEIAFLEAMVRIIRDNAYYHLDPARLQLLQNDSETFVRYFGHYYAYRYYGEHGEEAKKQWEKEQVLALQKSLPKYMWQPVS